MPARLAASTLGTIEALLAHASGESIAADRPVCPISEMAGPPADWRTVWAPLSALANSIYNEAMKRNPTGTDSRAKMKAAAAKRHLELIKGRRGISDDDTHAEAETAWDKARAEAKVMFKRLIGKAD
jgi:hypothetical protein